MLLVKVVSALSAPAVDKVQPVLQAHLESSVGFPRDFFHETMTGLLAATEKPEESKEFNMNASMHLMTTNATLPVPSIVYAVGLRIDNVGPTPSLALNIADIALTGFACGIFILLLIFARECTWTSFTQSRGKLAEASTTKEAEGKGGQQHTKFHSVRWQLYTVLVAIFFFADSLGSMPMQFMNGEAQVKGCGEAWIGVYGAVLGGASLIACLLATPILSFVGPTELIYFGLIVTVMSTVPQGLGRLIGAGTPEDPGTNCVGFSTYQIVLRLFEGLAVGLNAVAVETVAYRIFPMSEVGTAVGMAAGIRGLGAAAGPPLGGILYQVGGLPLPFVTMGVVLLVGLVLLMCLFRFGYGDITAVETKQATMQEVLRVPDFLKFLVIFVCSEGSYLTLDVLMQGWLGEEPYAYEMTKQNLVSFVSVGTFALCAGFVSPLTTLIGNVPTMIIGQVIAGFFFALVGFPNVMYPGEQPTFGFACLAVCGTSVGISMSIIASLPFGVYALDQAGFPQHVVGLPVAVVTVMAISLAGLVLQPIVTALKAAGGAYGTSWASLFLACINFAAVPIAAVGLRRSMHVAVTDEENQAKSAENVE